MVKKIFNPFIYIAGGKSFLVGMIVIFITSIVSYYSQTHFPDIISIKTSADYSIYYYILQAFSNLLIVSIVLYSASIMYSKSKVRFLDIIGTQSFARIPYFFASLIGFSKAMAYFADFIHSKVLNQGNELEFKLGLIITAIGLIMLSFLLTIWLIIWMYNGFSVSSNLKGKNSIFLFMISFVLSIVLSNIVNQQIVKLF